jgi:hypothetical protein
MLPFPALTSISQILLFILTIHQSFQLNYFALLVLTKGVA